MEPMNLEPSDSKPFRIPLQPELARRRHVPDERRSGDDSRTCQVSFTANTHTVLPVAIERGNRTLARRQSIRPLPEAGAAPRPANLAADRTEDLRNRFPAEARVGPFDLAAHASGPGENRERALGFADAA